MSFIIVFFQNQSDDFSNLSIILSELNEGSISTDCIVTAPVNNAESQNPDEASHLPSNECGESKLAEETKNPINEAKETEVANTNASSEKYESSDTPSKSRSSRVLNILGKTATAVFGATAAVVLGPTAIVLSGVAAAALHWARSKQAKETAPEEIARIADKLTKLVADDIIYSDVAVLLNILSMQFLQKVKADVVIYLKDLLSDLVERKLIDQEISDFISLQTNNFEGYQSGDSTASEDIVKEYSRLIEKGTLVPEFGEILLNIKMNYTGTMKNNDNNSSEPTGSSNVNKRTPEIAANGNNPEPDTLSPNTSSNNEECCQGAASAIPSLRQDEISKELQELSKRGILQPQQASVTPEVAQFLKNMAENNNKCHLGAPDAFPLQGDEMAKELEELVKRGHLDPKVASYLQENKPLEVLESKNVGLLNANPRRSIRENRWSTNSDNQRDDCKTEGQNDILESMILNADQLPLNWSRDHLIEPGSDEHFKLVPLRSGEAEYDAIANDFSTGGLTVTTIERVQNCNKWQAFVDEMKQVQRSRTQGELNLIVVMKYIKPQSHITFIKFACIA